MPVDLGEILGARTVAIFGSDPASQGQFVAFFLTNVTADFGPNVRLDLTQSVNVSSRYTVSRSPVERSVADDIKKMPRRVTVRGSLSANPIGLLRTVLGSFGSLLRRDLQQLEKLRTLQAQREPLILATPAGPFPSVALVGLDETHPGSNKVDLSLTFEEIEQVGPLAVSGAITLDALIAGATEQKNAGAQAVAAAPDPGGLG